MQKTFDSEQLENRIAGRGKRACGVLAGVIALVFFVACSKVPPLPDLDAPAGRFSPALARAHYERLNSLGPRAPGSEADALARTYLRRALERADARIDELPGRSGTRHQVATLSGRSGDALLVVAPWSVLGEAGGLDDAGAAVALELVRALSTRPSRPYELVVAFAEVSGATSDADPGDVELAFARDRLRLAGEDLVRVLEENGRFAGVRGVVVLEPRADGPTRIARDLRSHPVLRSIFWRAAGDLGLDTLFPNEAGWSSPAGLQGALHAAGRGAVLALVDERAGDAGHPNAGTGRTAAAAPTEPLAEWARIGLVADEGISRWMRRLERVDAFAGTPAE